MDNRRTENEAPSGHGTARTGFLQPARRDRRSLPAAAGPSSGLPAGERSNPKERAMNADRTSTLGRQTARAAAWIVGLVLVFAVGAPWLLNDAPPSFEAVVVARLCCAKAPGAGAPRVAPPLAVAR